MFLKSQESSDDKSFKDLTLLKHYHPNSEYHKQMEQSQTYMGYKLLWIMYLFLNGKNFPQGSIEDENWRTYVHDIMQFISEKDILKNIIQIDCDLFF